MKVKNLGSLKLGRNRDEKRKRIYSLVLLSSGV